jgi:hypothetical protein
MTLISIRANSGICCRELQELFFVQRQGTRQFLRAVAVALRGRSAIAASSPKISPGSTISSGLPSRVRMTSPSSSR